MDIRASVKKSIELSEDGEKMRYCYHDRFYQQTPIHGVQCDPIKNTVDKCICNQWSMLVLFEDGEPFTVGNRRALRLRHKRKDCELRLQAFTKRKT
jgi:hypothetical protein